MANLIIPNKEYTLVKDEGPHPESFNQRRDYPLERRALTLLNHHYPDGDWFVEVDVLGGVMKILSRKLSNTHGYILFLDKLVTDPDLHRVKMAGGQMYERAGRRRGKWDYEDLVVHVEGVRKQDQPMIINGKNFIP